MARTAQLGKPAGNTASAAIAQEAGASPRVLHDVYKLSDGRLKMIGVRHDARMGLVIPRTLADALTQAAQDRGITKTDLFEALVLEYLKKNGWEIGK